MIKFKELPVEIQERMLDEQVRQENPRNAEVFEKNRKADAKQGGFTWWAPAVVFTSNTSAFRGLPCRTCSSSILSCISTGSLSNCVILLSLKFMLIIY